MWRDWFVVLCYSQETIQHLISGSFWGLHEVLSIYSIYTAVPANHCQAQTWLWRLTRRRSSWWPAVFWGDREDNALLCQYWWWRAGSVGLLCPVAPENWFGLHPFLPSLTCVLLFVIPWLHSFSSSWNCLVPLKYLTSTDFIPQNYFFPKILVQKKISFFTVIFLRLFNIWLWIHFELLIVVP